MKRRLALKAFGLLCAAGLRSPAFGQARAKVWRVGFLGSANSPAGGLPPAPLRRGLAELGYVEGRNVAYEGRWANGKLDRLPALAGELVALEVDVIVLLGWLAADAARRATSSIPIVVSGVGDAVESRLVASLARPGGNLTGLSDVETVLSSKRLQLLKETVPQARRIAVLWNQNDAGMTLRYRKIDEAGRSLGVTVVGLGVREPDDFAQAFAAMTRTRPDAIFLVTDALTSLNRKRVIAFAAQHAIPAMYENSTYVRDGGLMSYGSSQEESLQRVAYFVDRILKGARAGDLPMEQPNRLYLVINQKTAAALGLEVPESVMLRVDEVVQ